MLLSLCRNRSVSFCEAFKAIVNRFMSQSAPNTEFSEIEKAIRNVPDFPKPGIQFKDITPVLKDPTLFQEIIHWMAQPYRGTPLDAVVGIDARGFIFGAGVALELGVGFVPIRKKGKLPYQTHEVRYDLEYGSNSIAIHTDAIRPGGKVIVIDDLLATGGTAAASIRLLHKVQAEVLEVCFFVELAFLNGKEAMGDVPVRSMLKYD